jgi:hypothetical protein
VFLVISLKLFSNCVFIDLVIINKRQVFESLTHSHYSYLCYGARFSDPVTSRQAVPTSITFCKETDLWYMSVGHLTMLSVAKLHNIKFKTGLQPSAS